MTEKRKNKKVKNNEEMSFWEHLEILRWHFIRSVIVVSILTIVAFIYKDIIFDKIILAPKEPDFITNKFFCWLGAKVNIDYLCINNVSLRLINTEMSGQFTLHIWISIISGLIISIPYILWEIWRFVKPALNEKERKYSSGFVFITSFLFLSGVVFSYYIIVPLTVNFFVTYSVSNIVENYISLSSYINTISSLCFATGLVFLFPVLVYFLTRIGILAPSFLSRNRKYIIVIILIIAAIITPPDVFSQIMVTIPLYALYELSIFISKSVYKRIKKQETVTN
ncbi:MAG TPA: twin-arginine translocase subunit TatC [Bacteroidales bacterium]|nr:twin-arginine translocase subunit TatC [Bacteroidales bacterium]HPS16094.1 twin-arginine translocase subunit TatC [Bacteroidales bacterium]